MKSRVASAPPPVEPRRADAPTAAHREILEALGESEERLRLALDAARMGTFDWDIVGSRVTWSGGKEELFGFAPGEFAGTYAAFEQRLHADDLPGVKAEFARCIATRTRCVHEFRVVWPDASEHWVAWQGEFVFGDSGEPLRMRGVVQDVTARKTSEAALRLRERDLSEAQRIAHIGSWSYGLTGWVTWSDETFRIYGVTPETFTPNAESFIDRVHPEDRPAMHTWIAACVAGDTPGEVQFRTVLPDGSVRVISGRGKLVRTGTGAPTHLTGTLQDITDRERAAEALREAEARLRLCVVASNIGLWDWNVLTNDLFFSPELKGQIGYADDEIPNRFEEWERRLHPDDLAPTLAKLRAFTADPAAHYAVEFRLRHKDGSYRWIFTQARALRDASGKALRMMGCHIDVTQREEDRLSVEESREQLRQLAGGLLSAREEERAKIAREIHDELGQMLTGLKMDVKSLEKRVLASEDQAKLSAMSLVVDDMVQAVRQIATDLRPGLLDDLGLAAAIEWQAEEFTKRTGIQCRARIGARKSELNPQASIAVFRIFQESLTNVAQHSGATAVTAAFGDAGGDLVLEVCDNGRGISTQDVRNPRSIGIAGMRERATLIGGTCDIWSAPGEGTTVRVRVPAGVARSAA